MSTRGPLVLVVIDGFGIAPPGPGNAVEIARTPALDALAREGSAGQLIASGLDVGLPAGQQGNSEVGHLNLGAGRRVPQMLVRIDEAISSGILARNPVLEGALRVGRERALHLVGLVGDGGVHAASRHLMALIDIARQAGVERIYVHAFTDGRDTRPDAALAAITAIEARVPIASVCGRYLAMDRDQRWLRTQAAYLAMVRGVADQHATSAVAAVRAAYDAGVGDEFIPATVIGDPMVGRIKDGDAVVYFNFRPDRARQLTQALTQREFHGFDRAGSPPRIHFVSMTRYKREWDIPVLFDADDVRQGLAEAVSGAGRRQLHVAETEKYAHVTFFFNGGREAPFDGEDRVLVQSPQDVATYDQAPAMSATGVRDAVIAGLAKPYEFIVVNFANADMVGHTGVVAAAVEGIETVDRCMADIRAAVHARNGLLVVTADHGNSEAMREPDGSPNTAHTINPVPLWIDRPGLSLTSGALGDVGPTVAGMMGWDIPRQMTGRMLITDGI